MKKMKCFRKMLALILALMMVFSAVSALAEGEDPEENQEPEVVDGEGTPENPENPKNPENPENPEVTENSPEGGTDSAKDAVLRGEKESGTQITTSVNITENTDGKFVYNKTEPVDVDDSDIKITYTTTDTKPTTEIIVKKDIQAENGHAIEIFCESQSESPESKLFLEAKDLSSNSENKSGLSLKNNRDDLTVSVGNVTGTDSGAYIVSGSGTTDFTCENAEGGNNGIDARNSSPELTIKAEDVKGESGNGITITNTGTSATADIGKAEGGYAGIEVNNQQGKTTVTASGRVSGGRNGIRAINLSGGTVEIKTGDIDVNNTNTDFPAIGVNVDSMNKKPQSASFSTGSITVTKQADSGKEAFGAYLKGRTELVANGDITVAATGTQTSSTGICVVGASDIIVTGSVTAKSEDGTAKGLWLKTTDSAPSAKADVLIEDTLSADTAIRLDSEDSAKNTSLTVWKVESTSEEAFIAGDVREETKNSFATAINYIVKTVQAAAGTFSATKADGSALEKHHDLETAHENDKVYIKAGEGYRVTEAYNGDTKLESDEGGFFYKVARGGGIMLKAVLELLPAVQPEEKKEDKKEETKSEVKKEEPKAEPKQEATQTVADTTSNTAAAAMRPAVYNLLKIKDKSGRADIAFRNIGTYEIKSPDGIDEGTFVTMNGRIVLTSRSGEMATVENGRLKYVVGDKTYEFEFSQAELDKLAGVKK